MVKAAQDRRIGFVESRYRAYRPNHPFDERFGVDTGGLIYDLPDGAKSYGSNNGYFAVAPSVFDGMLDRLRLDYSRFTFVDLGSGKGRALLLAARHGFRESVGVEISPALERIARRNARRFTRAGGCSPVKTLQADAAEFLFPRGPLLVYMWNAFTEPVLARVLHNLRRSLCDEPRDAYLLYVDPELDAMLAAKPWIEQLWLEEIPLSKEDFEAWAFPDRTESCAAYRLFAEPLVAAL